MSKPELLREGFFKDKDWKKERKNTFLIKLRNSWDQFQVLRRLR